MNGRFRTQTRILLLVILLAGIPLLSGLYAEGTPAEMKRTPAQLARPHFSPVLTDEKTLSEKINLYRQQNHLRMLKADWDLFRLARLEAKSRAAGKTHALVDHKLNTLLSGMGRSKIRVHSLIISVPPDKRLADPALWPGTAIDRFVSNKSVLFLGTGHARSADGEFWVLLTAEKIK
ncbi:hypothetical protein [Sporolactobacillus vineae]|uniref:hypothetical protein n=1 Tax=Sporolactobacillus vineae TaxID=444463 RepID=UPI000288EFA7|nr:hypothetical protein [Sporolactobacillus vineae]